MTTDDPTLARRGPIVTFWGAAQMVTGSMHLLEVGRAKVLLDCGLYQGRRDESRRRNAQFPFQPKQIAGVLLSHAHIDHCGNLPSLVRHGFDGPIFCTPATRDLLAVMLVDSAKIQEEEAAHLNIARQYAEPFVEPLYTRADVNSVLDQVVAVEYDRFRDVVPGVRFKFLEAGHVLGSAMTHIVTSGGQSLTFTGDLGRRHLPLLKHTAPIPQADVLVCESTYGNRTHEPIESTQRKLYEAINHTIARGGKVFIPAFSLGRTQLIIHYIHRGILDGNIPRVPVYVDSPLAADITGVYESHPECLDAEGQQMLKDGVGILGGDVVTYIREFEDSIRTSRRPEPSITIASSGMCDAGRIQHHLKEHIDDPRCTVILVSYQAQGTTGRRLLEKSPTIKFLGKEWNKWIEVVHLDGFSGHADRSDFLAYLEPLAGQVGKVRLIHGEREQAESLAEALRDIGFFDVDVPMPGDVVDVG
ncbi:MAG TPA: MBL fold metallo-hydrolase [Gemmataceae bacterium]|jgi:metallo-beta-lactamase family protein|nr:MBL fold metallo-hydrolase [Gemmataceae bacterium]